MSDETIHIHIHVTIPTDKRSDFLALMHELVEQSEKEPGTLIYEWFFDDEQRICHIHERYLNIAEGNKHVRNFAENYAARFFAAIDSVDCQVCGVPGDYIRSVLDGIKPLYATKGAGFNRF